MRKKKVLLGLILSVLMLSFLFTGCETGVAQEIYDQVASQVEDIQEKLNAAQNEKFDLEIRAGFELTGVLPIMTFSEMIWIMQAGNV